MRLHLFLLFSFSHHPFISTIFAYSTSDNKHINQNNSTFNIDLYQCDTNNTILNSTINTNDRIFNNLIDSCSISCCTSNSSNKTTSSNICQVTVQSFTNICLGRLCYSGECDGFALLANMTHDYSINNKTAIINKISSSFGSISWSSLVNSTEMEWSSWIDKTSLTMRRIILIILLITSISLTFMTLIVVIKSIRHAKIVSNRKSYRYTLL